MKKFKSTKALLLVFLMMFVLTACSTTKNEDTVIPNEAITQAPEETSKDNSNVPIINTLPIVDREHNPILLPETINSIISLSPSNTEILIALGMGDKIIAGDTQTQAYNLLPNVTTYFDMMAPDAEQMIALNPDIVYVSSMSVVGDLNPFKPLTDAGIVVAYIPSSESIQGLYDDISFVANSLQLFAEGQAILDSMSSTIEEITATANTIEDKKTVYFEISAAPYMYSFGTSTFLNEMIDIVGATNVLEDQTGWISVSEEVALSANPDVILTSVNYIDNPVDEIKSREGWNTVNAVANDQVHYIDNKLSSLPNQNIIGALKEMAEAIYPDLYTFE